MILRDPNIEISGCISWISFDHAFRISRSCASYHEGPFWFDVWRALAPDEPMGGSTGADFSGSGVIPRCISKRADGIHGRSREDRLIAPCEKILE